MNTSENRETVLNKSYSAYVKNRDDLELFKSLNERVIAIFKDFSKAFYPMRQYDERYRRYFDILRDNDKTEQGLELRIKTRALFKELLNEHGLSKNDCHIYFHKHLSDEEHQTAVEQINYIYNYFLKSVLRDKSLGYFYDNLSRNNRFCLNISPSNYSGIQPLYVFDQTMNLSF